MANIHQVWFVLPLELTPDPNRPMWGPEFEVDNNAFRARRPAGLERIAEAPLQAAVNFGQPRVENEGQPNQIVGRGKGFYLDRNSRNKFEKVFTTRELANEEAKKLAQSTPKVPYGVFTCTEVYETTSPEVIEKQFTEAGELVIKVL